MVLKQYKNIKSFLEEVSPSNYSRGTIDINEWFEGRYQINEILGYGHTSVVFGATDTHLERTVALKILHGASYKIDPSILLKEAKFLAKLEHPLIVKVYDFGLEPNLNRPWSILEYLGKVTLLDFIRSRPDHLFDINLFRNIAMQLVEILCYLHNNADLFQLDIKPGNLSFHDHSNSIKIMDLGSAYNRGDTSIQRLGSPGYIAPELFSHEDITQKCDLFSMGMLLFEFIAGTNPLFDIQKEVLDLGKTNDSSSTEIIINEQKSLAEITAAIALDVETSNKNSNQKNTKYLKLLMDMRKINLQKEMKNKGIPKEISSLICNLTSYEAQERKSANETKIYLNELFLEQSSKKLPSVFISHSHLDKQRFVNKFADFLSSKGFSVWIDDKSLRAGDDFWQKIGQAIEDSNFVIIILSDNSISSSGVSEELRTAQLYNLQSTKILPIRIDPIKFSQFPHHLRSRHILDFVGWENPDVFEKKVNKLISDMISLFYDTEKLEA